MIAPILPINPISISYQYSIVFLDGNELDHHTGFFPIQIGNHMLCNRNKTSFQLTSINIFAYLFLDKLLN
nr:MAG TPA: hypothetical protein [Caudoviricetes sp.]